MTKFKMRMYAGVISFLSTLLLMVTMVMLWSFGILPTEAFQEFAIWVGYTLLGLIFLCLVLLLVEVVCAFRKDWRKNED